MKIFDYYIQFLVSKIPIDKEKLQMLKEGTAHLRKNPKRKEKVDKK